ncbi:hypothetical protein Salat_0554000 [Sesamum alatum]|uniref:Uncharacterized protein n=1 Tax=Sesamum alatum TaxID=300844 RepID=A0AAE1YQ79_9LAMI|nr:hypothetical protein Salat_0554000 [Sesamum alatum]
MTEKYGVEFFVKSAAFDENYPVGSPHRNDIENNVIKDYKDMLGRYCQTEMQRLCKSGSTSQTGSVWSRAAVLDQASPFDSLLATGLTTHAEKGVNDQKSSVAGVVVAAEDGYSVVEKQQNEQEEQRDADGGAAGPVDGVGLAAGGEYRGVGGEELDDEEEEYGEEEADGAEQLGYEACYGLALVAEQRRQNQHKHHYGGEDGRVGRSGAAFFYHIFMVVVCACVCVFS